MDFRRFVPRNDYRLCLLVCLRLLVVFFVFLLDFPPNMPGCAFVWYILPVGALGNLFACSSLIKSFTIVFAACLSFFAWFIALFFSYSIQFFNSSPFLSLHKSRNLLFIDDGFTS